MSSWIAIIFGLFGIGVTALPKKTKDKVFGPFRLFGPPRKSTIDAIAFTKAKDLIKRHEGYRRVAYLDSVGILTVGIGHRVLSKDRITLGQRISDARANDFFKADIQKAFNAARAQALELNKYDADLIAALTSVNYQLGTGWTRIFKNTWYDLKTGNVQSAIKKLFQSKWYRQTPVRVSSFVDALRGTYGAG